MSVGCLRCTRERRIEETLDKLLVREDSGCDLAVRESQ